MIKIPFMRDLFSDQLPLPTVPSAISAPAREQKQPGKVAKEFVRWCCSFGPAFRNSPDISNLRFWMHKTRLKLKDREEYEVLEAARVEFVKRVEQLVRKSEPT
jgi:hypothetical protein